MRFAEKIAIFILRPFYRTFVERPLWWFLARVRIFFMSDTSARLDNVEQQLGEVRKAIEEGLRRSEENDRAQWDALEQLLLGLFHQPQLRTIARNEDSATPREAQVSMAPPLNRTNAASNIR